jgi:hypothetical protein
MILTGEYSEAGLINDSFTHAYLVSKAVAFS